jgi:hypothetical protein
MEKEKAQSLKKKLKIFILSDGEPIEIGAGESILVNVGARYVCGYILRKKDIFERYL